MSLDQETDTVILGSVSKASLATDLWIINEDSHLSSRGMLVNSSERPASRFINSMMPFCSSSSFSSALTGTVNSCLSKS